ncbi:hypothetical protein D3C87_64570 [compost metagenome]
MKFSSRKSALFHILILGSAAFLIFFPAFGIPLNWIEKTDYWILIPFAAITALFLWIYFGTHYIVTETELIYRSGPLRGRIQIDQIREIVKEKTLYTGLKPATASKGLIVRFGKYDEIYISPDSNESFITEILERNSQVIISE